MYSLLEDTEKRRGDAFGRLLYETLRVACFHKVVRLRTVEIFAGDRLL
ncbi:MAG: hypothetical protein V7K69_17965 [Nostoc sp.]